MLRNVERKATQTGNKLENHWLYLDVNTVAQSTMELKTVFQPS